ncbi:AAA family ATPase [Oceanimonas smirnovii]|uniref:AAA family ATPase n=1 Tax=Oceanimonas smirnovii TaxID=264574 RepID=A0ABW7NZA1_9GAMM
MTGSVRALSSQQQLLERLLHLARLDHELALVSGPKGAGKSTLATLLTQQSELLTPVVLDARLITSQKVFREALLEQWFAGAIFDAGDPLSDSVNRLLPAAPGKRLLVVDNAQWLTDAQLQELAEMSLALPSAQRPFMVLMGLSSWASGVRTLLQELQMPVLELEVPELSEEDKLQLCSLRDSAPAAGQLAGMHYPGDLVVSTEPSMKTPEYRQWLEQKPVKILLTGLIIVGLGVIVSALLGKDEAPPAQVAQPFQAESLPEPPAGPVTADTLPVTPAAEEQGEALVSDWPVEPLPDSPQVATQVAETPKDTSKERVVIDDEVVSQLMQRKTVQAVSKQAQSAPAAQPAAGQPAALSRQPAGHYTLQLMASRDKNALNQLMTRHNLSPAWVYSRNLNGQPWYVLVHGDFASAEQARAAVGRLPAELRAAKPWPKPFGQVQKEATP